MTEEIQAWTDADLAYRIVLLKTLADLVLKEFAAAKAIAAQQYPKGATIPARTETADGDIKLGRVQKSDPAPKATVVDEEAFEAWVRDEHPDKLNHHVEFTDLSQVLAILLDQDRKDLIAEVWDVPDWLRSQVLAAAVAGTQVAGVVVARPAGTVSAHPAVAAEYAVRRLLSGSPVPLLGIEA